MNKGSYLELILGCMWAGKTTQLFTLHKQYSLSNLKPILINYSKIKDNSNMMKNHNNDEIECIWCTKLSDITSKLINYDCYLINEGQFFDDIDIWVINMLQNHNKTIYIAALDGDFEKKPFPKIMNLIPHSDNINKLKAICTRCKNGTYAIFTKRLNSNKEKILFEINAYSPVCRKCY